MRALMLQDVRGKFEMVKLKVITRSYEVKTLLLDIHEIEGSKAILLFGVRYEFACKHVVFPLELLIFLTIAALTSFTPLVRRP